MPRCKATDCDSSFTRAKGDIRTTWCSVDCAVSIARQRQDRDRTKAAAKAKKKIKDQSKANKQAVRELNRRDRRWQHKATQPVFNRMRVLEEKLWFKERGQEPYCISCGKTNMDWCCGHYKTVGGNGLLRYDTANTYLQCNRYCNMGKSGNIMEYMEGILARFGTKEGSAIIDYCDTTHQPANWAWQDIEQMRLGFLARIKTLEADLSL